MQYLEPPDTHHLSAAVGWLELGNIAEAKLELAQIRPSQRDQPDVLEVCWAISQQESDWETGLRAASALVDCAPERPSGWLHRAYSLRRAANGGLRLAWEALLPAADRFPDEPTIPYNLSCYACQMRELDTARVWLKRAMAVGGKGSIKQMALGDPDLEALWEEIRLL